MRARAKSSAPAPAVSVAPVSKTRTRRIDLLCALVLFLATTAFYSPALFTGKVLLPADTVLLMAPWSAHVPEKYPDFHLPQNQMHGPIFEYYSWRHYARERIRAGEVPLWNPYELSGNVLLANSQSAVLYPPNVLLYLFSLPVGINLVTFLHTFLTGLFAYGLLRVLRRGPPAALTGALVWMFCGLLTVWTEFQTPTAALCWLPAALLAWEIALQRRDARWAVLGSGGAVAMTLLAGHLHFAFYVVLAFALYALWRLPKDRPHALRTAGLLGATLLFGFLLSMCTLLPVLEMGRMNFRAGQTEYATSVSLRIPPQNLLTLLQPNLFGNPRDYAQSGPNGALVSMNPYWGFFDFIEYTCYLGIPALILALLGIPSFRKRQPAHGELAAEQHDTGRSPWVFFSLLALLGLLLALGSPICALFYYGVPGYRQFNATARALSLFSFAAAMLAGQGLQTLLDAVELGNRKALARRVAATVAVVIAAGLAAFPGSAPFFTTPDEKGAPIAFLLSDSWLGYEMTGAVRFLVFAMLTGIDLAILLRRNTPASARRALLWVIPALAAADLWTAFGGFNPVTEPGMLGFPTATTDFLSSEKVARTVSLETPGRGAKSFIVPNYNAVAHYREAQGADSLHTKRYHHLMEGVVKAMGRGVEIAFPDPNTIHFSAIHHPVFNLLNVRYFTTELRRDPPHPVRHQAASAELAIWENDAAFGAAWIAGSASRVRSLEEILNRFEERSFDAKKTALVESEPPPLTAASGRAELTRFSRHELSYRTDTDGAGLLVTSEISFPGWRAFVDGRETTPITADYILRSVVVPAGRHDVTFRYEPASYRVGLFLTALCCGLFSATLAFRKPRRRPT